MPMIIGMYLPIPFVSNGVRNFDKRTIFQATIIFSFLSFSLPFISVLLDIWRIQNAVIQYYIGFSGGIYGVYIILGNLVKKGRKYLSKIIEIITIISFAFVYFFSIEHIL